MGIDRHDTVLVGAIVQDDVAKVLLESNTVNTWLRADPYKQARRHHTC